MRRHRLSTVLRGGIAVIALGTSGVAFAGSAAADATDEYPIPHRMIITTCTAEQILAAARDFEPIYYERYMIDKHNRPPDVQQAAVDRARWFYTLPPDQRRAYSEEIATNIYGEPMAQRWGNWAKVFFNNKGVAAKETDNCANYSLDDASVWDG
jgi:hypothetical protein